MKTNWHRWLVAFGSLGVLVVGLAAAPGQKSHGPTHVKPVVYTESTAPPVSDSEAERAITSAKDLSTAFRVAAARVLPSLVTIETTSAQEVDDSNRSRRDPFGNGRNPFEGTPFEDMFRDAPHGFRFEMPEGRQDGVGSGVIIDSSGLIMTNSHVVGGGKNVNVLVRLSDGREFKAVDVRTDPKTDIAIVRIEGADDLVAAKLGNSDTVSVGDWVLALGQPFGLESTVTAGIISATRRGVVGINARESYLQTDAAINPGNSGGPLVNLDGQVIGINTAISSRGGGNDGVGFAIPVSLAKWVGDQLAATGTVRRAYLGIQIQNITAKEAKHFGVRPRGGVLVSKVMPDTPAAKAGVQPGDVIVKFAGVKVTNPSELQVIVERSTLGQPHDLEIIRDEKPMTLSFVPEEQPANYDEIAKANRSFTTPGDGSALSSLGFEVSELNANVARQLGFKETEGVVITSVTPDSPADQAGLESGQLITQVNRQEVKSLEDFQSVVKEAKLDEGLLLLVKSQQGSRYVVINGN